MTSDTQLYSKSISNTCPAGNTLGVQRHYQHPIELSDSERVRFNTYQQQQEYTSAELKREHIHDNLTIAFSAVAVLLQGGVS
ncbi:hypothetical protein CVFO_0666 [Isorropodon fossajaponicum endosymbiont JTNG4]|uniref:hypothetical protein n=1 Tax=Isorropodon fossajaponicum symbiont TaxID=883811 RepID=UPI0019161DDD|nr:hypothetical protein [Isorropodon fossajaponicum symbiont]BBB23898.1 hypothetical protein CVFO_0666 [Isorropodon fossajaponicum endosymbiont JTNG4]